VVDRRLPAVPQQSDRGTVDRAWRGLAAHVADDGTVIDVCTSTGSGPTKRYYMDRQAITGADAG